ncbi:DNA-cytosine methyltransferase [Bifidobacterium moukalabense DSM 27321]|uniref:DNA-cytosine methyltransferase n=1 Tax=Bifidobacterium moukalabense DSM 27321 TaxID=1435051 RepID=W4NB58_9BIFI|nr:DNA-cytosine methyltransferase [Bifidobacterium moukalabense DSM 27321]
MRYISLFSGIEAATVAWEPLGWEPVAYAEIEPFPKAVLKHHYPNVPDLGDMTKVDWSKYHHAADVVVGGSPARHSALPDSGRLWLTRAASSCSNISELAQKLIRNGSYGKTYPEYCRLNTEGPSSRSLKPWPNSGLMGGAAWRVLDAQFYGVAQRRERVFLVVNTRDWRRAAPVLFERESLCWDHSSSREKRKSLTEGTAECTGNADQRVKSFSWNAGSKAGSIAYGDVAPTLKTEHNPAIHKSVMLDFHQQDGRFKVSDHSDVSNTLTSHMGTGGNNVPLIHQVDEIERESMPLKMICRADTQANAAQGFDLSPTLMAHAGQDAPFIYPAQVTD